MKNSPNLKNNLKTEKSKLKEKRTYLIKGKNNKR